MSTNHRFTFPVATTILAMLALSCVGVFAQGANSLTAVDVKSAIPAPRTADGHPDLSGYWKGTRDTKPGGNIGKIFRDSSCR